VIIESDDHVAQRERGPRRRDDDTTLAPRRPGPRGSRAGWSGSAASIVTAWVSSSRLLSAYVPGGTNTVLSSDRGDLSVHGAIGEAGHAVSAAFGGSAVVETVNVSARAAAGNRSTAASSEPRRTSDVRVIGLRG
jgi:hypothetical protein